MVTERKGSWILEYSDTGKKSFSSYEMFDKVIIAAPWNSSALLSPETSASHEQIQYLSLWLTLFVLNSTLNTKYFGSPPTLPAQILPTLPPNSFLHFKAFKKPPS